MASFTAAHDGGPCGTCDVRIREGDEVAYDGTNRLVHVTCPVLDRPAGKICPDCFMELPASGACGSC